MKKFIRLTPENVVKHVGKEVVFKTRNRHIVKKIISCADSRKSIVVEHDDLGNCLNLSRKLYVIDETNTTEEYRSKDLIRKEIASEFQSKLDSLKATIEELKKQNNKLQSTIDNYNKESELVVNDIETEEEEEEEIDVYEFKHDGKQYYRQFNSNNVYNEEQSLEVLTPTQSDNIFLVRISDRRGALQAREDYANMVSELSDLSKPAIWDKDSNNKIKEGDWLGFILGPTHGATVELFKVESESPSINRSEEWSNTHHTDQITDSVRNREVITLSKDIPMIKKSWNSWKESVQYKEGYMPRGTTRVRNPW